MMYGISLISHVVDTPEVTRIPLQIAIRALIIKFTRNLGAAWSIFGISMSLWNFAGVYASVLRMRQPNSREGYKKSKMPSISFEISLNVTKNRFIIFWNEYASQIITKTNTSLTRRCRRARGSVIFISYLILETNTRYSHHEKYSWTATTACVMNISGISRNAEAV